MDEIERGQEQPQPHNPQEQSVKDLHPSIEGNTQQEPAEHQTDKANYQGRGFLQRVKGILTSHRTKAFIADPRVWLELLALVVVVKYTIYAGRQATIMNDTLAQIRMQTPKISDSADAAESAAKTAHDSLVKLNRPWVGVEGVPQITGPAQISVENGDRRADLEVKTVFKDFGAGPALHVGSYLLNSDRLPLPRSADEEFVYEKIDVDTACRLAESKAIPTKAIPKINSPPGLDNFFTGRFGQYIFPAQPFTVTDHLELPALSKRANRIRFVGCIAYEDQFSSVPHHTAFCFMGTGTIEQAGLKTAFTNCPIDHDID